jgi:hypothetical protein
MATSVPSALKLAQTSSSCSGARVPRPLRIVDRSGDNPRAPILKLTEQTLL